MRWRSKRYECEQQLALHLVVVERPSPDAWRAADMPLPRSVQEIADVIGREQALKLVESIEPFERADRRYPGKKWKSLMLYVPKALRQNDPLVAVIGLEGALKMIGHFGGEMLSLASCAKARQLARNRLICTLIDQGVAPCEVSVLVGITKSYVRKIAREMPPEARN